MYSLKRLSPIQGSLNITPPWTKCPFALPTFEGGNKGNLFKEFTIKNVAGKDERLFPLPKEC